MRLAAALLLGMLLLRAAQAAEPPAEGRASVDVVAPSRAVYVGEEIPLVLRVGYDRAFFDEHAVPLFRQRMDVPLQVRAPWLMALPGARLRAEPRGDAQPSRTFALGDDVISAPVVAERRAEGRVWDVLETRWRLVPTLEGALEIPASRLRFAYATRFEEDLLGGRVPFDRQDAFVEGGALVLEVLPLPAEGRPAEFGGAIGRFALAAKVAQRAGDDGGRYRVTLVLEGEGNFDVLEPPPPERLAGFHVYGRLVERGAQRLTVTYDVSPLRPDVRGVPPIRFAFLDPGPPAAYRVTHSHPLPLEGPASPVRGGEGGTPPVGEKSGASTLLRVAAVVVGLIVLLVLGRVVASRRRSGAAHEPTTTRIHASTATLRRRLGQADADLADPFAEVLAAHLGCPPAAVHAPDLAPRLVASGVPPDLARKAAWTLERLVGLRYGGGELEDGAAAVGRLLEALEAAWGDAASAASPPPS